MCGIAGLLAPGGRDLEATAEGMAATLAHRGPDGAGVWADEAAGIALGHHRLAIIDLSEAGQQPMVSSCGRMVISYNGEIYNAPELRAELEGRGRRFRGHSDTEVLVEGAAEWGIEALLHRLIGMFAIAFWDREARRLTLVRDRFGIKPLYWGWADDAFVFGSELKALTAHPNFRREIDREAVARYLRFAYVPAPFSIWRAARKLGAGEMLEVEPGGTPTIRPWWRLADLVREARAQPFAGSEEEAAEALEALLRDAVARRMVADVPLGAFLSGGIDSSTVVALMQAAGRGPVKTFTIGFDIPGYDESRHAAAVAEHLETEHTEHILSPEDALALVPKLPRIYDEPFADSSQIPTFFVSRLTRRHVTVALSGDGGDELFAGYTRYIEAAGRIGKLWRLPSWVQQIGAAALDSVPAWAWNRALSWMPNPAQRMQKVVAALGAGPEAFYGEMVSVWRPPDVNRLTDEHPPWLGGGMLEELWEEAASLLPDPIARMQYVDALTYLVDDILTKVDRASMAVSLEVRVPLLDHRVAAFAFAQPRNRHLAGRLSKRLLRKVLYGHVPPELIERPKHGFGMPVAEWLRGPLHEWAADLLSVQKLEAKGIENPAPVLRAWTEHQSGRRDHAMRLWTVLMLAAHQG